MIYEQLDKVNFLSSVHWSVWRLVAEATVNVNVLIDAPRCSPEALGRLELVAFI
jgi:hypothetical protein